ncbi:hypothetical protein AALP_AA3G032600 [Arabis alpina]|uniref:ADP-ribosyl cyclase/cyclic ADP-ribose hydrolase n=1 Tax=Arabis alpina TaxID=50452 RepID=A0A087H6R1_ARAAL|nr:hypothetical protein AALP_AA3G032600 [Arabis alpina]
MDFYLSLRALAATIFELFGTIFTLFGVIFTRLGTICTLLGSMFHMVYEKIRVQENTSHPSPPSSASLLSQSPSMASSASLTCQSPVMAFTSLSLSPPSPPSPPSSTYLLCQSPTMASSSLSLSPPSPPSPPSSTSLLCHSPKMASSLSLSPPSSPSLICQSLIMASPPSLLSQIPTLASSPPSPLSSPSLICQSPIMASPSSLPLSLPLSSPSRSWEHDVFPSFHGPDVRKDFLSHILKDFRSKGIDLFIDNNIRRGESIGPELKKAIRGSKIAIVLLSKNYASSSWCLDELVEIMKKELGQTVITIFYKVDPTDVKKQTGDFGKVFKETCQYKTKEKIHTWRKALEGVATIAGYHSSKWDDEATMIEKIGDDISKMLIGLAPSPGLGLLIGMGAHMEEMQQLLRLDLEDEVRMIGIWGPVGIGKSTIARFLFHQLSRNFPQSAIMEIRENYPRPCLDEGSAQLKLQNLMLSLVINHKDTMITHLGVAPERLKDRRVLLILDDVDQLAQLHALAGGIRWFGPGSRIIITTEDQKILNDHGINLIYKVDYPIDEEALQIFCSHAFGQKSPYDGFEELAREVIRLSGKLPLGLKVMGSYFRGMSKDEWTMALPGLRESLNGEIESILQFSYDALCDEDKEIFLHIACFFSNNYGMVERVEEHLAKKFLNVRQRLQVLVEKSLIYFNDQRKIEIHTLLAQLGKTIVHKQSREPRQRQFLVGGKDICDVFTDPAAVTRSVIGISEFLVELNMSFSKLKKLWEGIKPLQNLKWINLDYSKDLKKLPNLSTAINLEELKLNGCLSLVKLPSSIGNATNLQELNLVGCSSLVKLPSWIENATNFQKLNLAWCSSLVELPSSIGNINLQELNLKRCSSLVKLSSFILDATNLQELNLEGCSSLVELPSSIGNATNLQELNLEWCTSLVELPSSIGNATNLQELNLEWCSSLVELPSSIGNLHKLTKLNLRMCSKLEVIPTNITLESLKELDLRYCSSLKSFPEISTNIEVLKLSGTAIEEMPSSIMSLFRHKKLEMSYYENLNEYMPAFESITELHLGNIQEIGPWVKGCSRLKLLDVSYCRKLVSIPQLPDSISKVNAYNCESLERLDCSIRNPNIHHLNFGNCFKLNQEARDLIIQTPTRRKYSVLPGEEVPACFTYRASGSSLTVKLNEKPLGTSIKFKACILLVHKGQDHYWASVHVDCRIITSNKVSCRSYDLERALSEHLYIFEVELEEVTSTELVFEFNLKDFWFNVEQFWEIKECGVLQILEHQGMKILDLSEDSDKEM